MGNGEWGMGNGEWGMGNGEWGMGKKEEGRWKKTYAASFLVICILCLTGLTHDYVTPTDRWFLYTEGGLTQITPPSGWFLYRLEGGVTDGFA